MQDAIMHYMRINVAGVNNAPMGLYPSAPGGPNDYVYIMTSRANPDHWDRLLKLIDLPRVRGHYSPWRSLGPVAAP